MAIVERELALQRSAIFQFLITINMSLRWSEDCLQEPGCHGRATKVTTSLKRLLQKSRDKDGQLFFVTSPRLRRLM